MTFTITPAMLWAAACLAPFAAGAVLLASPLMRPHGDYDFGPSLFAFAWLIGSLAWWAALLIGAVL